MDYTLKCWPEHFAAVLSGAKPYEVRKADRPYAVGDVLMLREWRPYVYEDAFADYTRNLAGSPDEIPAAWEAAHAQATEDAYTGRECRRRVTHILQGGQFGIERGYVVLGIAPLESEHQP